VEAVLVQLRRTEEIALKRGRALAIGHPHATTIAALLKWLPTLKERGFVLVPASALLHQETATAGEGGKKDRRWGRFSPDSIQRREHRTGCGDAAQGMLAQGNQPRRRLGRDR